jgi:hypothetical protein
MGRKKTYERVENINDKGENIITHKGYIHRKSERVLYLGKRILIKYIISFYPDGDRKIHYFSFKYGRSLHTLDNDAVLQLAQAGDYVEISTLNGDSNPINVVWEPQDEIE